MEPFNPQALIARLSWRYAVKQFDPNRRVSDADWGVLKKTLVLTPSSYGLQPWRFIVVANPELRKRLTFASKNQGQVESCSHFVVMARIRELTEDHIERHLLRIAQVRKQSVEELAVLRRMMVQALIKDAVSGGVDRWACNQIYIALGNLMTCAAILEIDTCPLEGIYPEQYDEILSLKAQNLCTVVACAVGYRSPSDRYANAKKVRFEESDVIEVIE